MILGQQQANKVMPLVINIEAYEAFLYLLDTIQAQTYKDLLVNEFEAFKDRNIGVLQLVEELKELKVRMKDSLKNG